MFDTHTHSHTHSLTHPLTHSLTRHRLCRTLGQSNNYKPHQQLPQSQGQFAECCQRRVLQANRRPCLLRSGLCVCVCVFTKVECKEFFGAFVVAHSALFGRSELEADGSWWLEFRQGIHRTYFSPFTYHLRCFSNHTHSVLFLSCTSFSTQNAQRRIVE